jgi:hypothetical protein
VQPIIAINMQITIPQIVLLSQQQIPKETLQTLQTKIMSSE